MEISLIKSKNPEDCGLKLIPLQDAAGANAYHIPNILIVYDPLDYKMNKDFRQNIYFEYYPSILKIFLILFLLI